MSSIVKAGVGMGLLVGVWMFIVGAVGWYKDSSTAWIFTLGATLILVGSLIWGLMQTAKEGRRYGGQVLAGLLICLISGVIIIVVSWIWSSFVVTDIFDVTAQMQAEAWESRGMSEDEIDAMLEQTAMTRTPVFQALMGFVGTMVTGLIVSLIAASFIRKKD